MSILDGRVLSKIEVPGRFLSIENGDTLRCGLVVAGVPCLRKSHTVACIIKQQVLTSRSRA
jgi:hypothetical protein